METSRKVYMQKFERLNGELKKALVALGGAFNNVLGIRIHPQTLLKLMPAARVQLKKYYEKVEWQGKRILYVNT